jgi:hypothetical protein
MSTKVTSQTQAASHWRIDGRGKLKHFFKIYTKHLQIISTNYEKLFFLIFKAQNCNLAEQNKEYANAENHKKNDYNSL